MDKDDYDRRHYQHRHQPEPYLPKRRRPSYDYKSYEPYLPPDRKYGRRPYYDGSKYYREREKDRNYWGLNKKGYTWGSYGRPVPNYDYNHHGYEYDGRKNYYLPSKVESTGNWGVYGGSYGSGGHKSYNKYQNQYDYWGINKPTNSGSYNSVKYYDYGELPPYEKPAGGSITYLPVNSYDRPRRIFHHTPQGVHSNSLDTFSSQDKHFSISRRPGGYNFVKEGITSHNHAIYFVLKSFFLECSLRTATGIKLRRPITKKVLSVPNIYECEAFCFAEKEFRCGSYAYRYVAL